MRSKNTNNSKEGGSLLSMEWMSGSLPIFLRNGSFAQSGKLFLQYKILREMIQHDKNFY